MTSSVMQIEVSSVRDVRTDDVSLTATLADGRVISTPLEWYPRLAYGTAAERAEWQLIGDGSGIHWPRLDEDLSVEGLIAGRKSGESASSLKRWMAIQDKLRQSPATFPELRREVLQTGPLAAADIVERTRSTVNAYESAPNRWHVLMVSDPFDWLQRAGLKEESPISVYGASSTAAAMQAVEDCVVNGFVRENENVVAPDGRPYVLIYSVSVGERDS